MTTTTNMEQDKPTNTNSSSSNSTLVDDPLQLLLKEAGLESIPIDPSSLQALKDIVVATSSSDSMEENDNDNYNYNDDNEYDNTESQPPPFSEVHPHLKRYTSELTTPSVDGYDDEEEEEEEEEEDNNNNNNNNNNENNTDDLSMAVVGGDGFVPLPEASVVENRILEQSHRQTRIMMEMQHQIDVLTDIVESNAAMNGTGIITTKEGVAAAAAATAATSSGGKSARTATAVAAAQPPAAGAGGGAGAPPQAQPVLFPGQRVFTYDAANNIWRRRNRRFEANNNNNNNNNNNIGFFRNLGRTVLQLRIVRIMQAFVRLRRRYGVLPLDGGLIIKALFMVAILGTRMLSSSKRFDSGSEYDAQLKVAALGMMVLLGFFVHTGYLKYSYIFFIKENIATRIWRGESIEDILTTTTAGAPGAAGGGGAGAAAANHNNNDNNNNQLGLPRGNVPPGQPQRHPNNNNQQQQQHGWRNTFLGGIIPQANQGGIVGAFQDIALLFGSFLLSIFPMWQPEGPPPAPQQVQLPPQQQNQNQQNLPPDAVGGLGAGPGEVRPPRNVMQAEEDSDEEQDNQ